MDVSLGKDYMYIVPKLDKAGKAGVEAELKGIDGSAAGEGIGASLFAGVKKALVALGIADMVGSLLRSSIGAYADYEQLIGGVELAVEIGALGELTWVGHAATVLHQQFQYFVQDIAGAVAADFYAVFARVGVGSTEEGEQHFVDGDGML